MDHRVTDTMDLIVLRRALVEASMYDPEPDEILAQGTFPYLFEYL
jgi:hypothetical protein